MTKNSIDIPQSFLFAPEDGTPVLLATGTDTAVDALESLATDGN